MKYPTRLIVSTVAALVVMGQGRRALAQTPQPRRPCNLTIAQSPRIRDVGLRMSVADAIAVLPTIKTKHARDLIPSEIDTVYVMLQPPLGTMKPVN